MRDAIRASMETNDISTIELSRRSGMLAGTIRDMLNFWRRGSVPAWQKLLTAAEVELGYRLKEKV